jgi:hypothetical protein
LLRYRCLVVGPLRHILLPLASSLPSVHLEKGHLQRLVLPMGEFDVDIYSLCSLKVSAFKQRS